MDSRTITYIFYGIYFAMFFITVFGIFYCYSKITMYREIRFFIDGYLKVKQMKNENKKMELFMAMDSKLAEQEVDEYIKKHVNEYVLENFIVKKIEYIKKPDIELMVKKLDREIMLHISELYVFYIKVVYNINDENDLLVYIDKKVKEHVLDLVTQYNKTETPIA